MLASGTSCPAKALCLVLPLAANELVVKDLNSECVLATLRVWTANRGPLDVFGSILIAIRKAGTRRRVVVVSSLRGARRTDTSMKTPKRLLRDVGRAIVAAVARRVTMWVTSSTDVA